MVGWQGDQKSPGIIPLAVKDVFSIIQEVGLCTLRLKLQMRRQLVVIISSLYYQFPEFDCNEKSRLSTVMYLIQEAAS